MRREILRTSKSVRFDLSSLIVDLLLLRPCCAEPSPDRIVGVAQTYIHQRGIPPTKVVIVDASSLLKDGPMRLNTSLLSLQASDVPKNQIFSETSPILLEALAVPSLIVVLSRYRPGEMLSDFVQNIQHKCLLQIILTDIILSVASSGVSYLWVPGGVPALYCARTFDQLLTAWPRKASKSCGEPVLSCRLLDVLHETRVFPLTFIYRLTLRISCNRTEFSLVYQNPWITSAQLSAHEIHMRSRYSSCYEPIECHYLIPRSVTDVTFLLKPFGPDVWLVTCLSGLLMAILFTWAQPEPITTKICQMSLLFISAGAIEAKCRKYSALIIVCAMVSMTFILSAIYSNTVMSHFLDTASEQKPNEVINCKFVTLCDTMFSTEQVDITGRLSYHCDLSEKAKLAVGRPLRRDFLQHSDHRLLWSASSLNNTNVRDCHLQRMWKAPILRPKSSVLLLVLAHTSVTFERLLQHGFIGSRMFRRNIRQRTNSNVSNLADFTVLDLTRLRRRNHTDWNKYLSFDQEASLFDHMKFLDLLPLFALCGLFILGSAVIELWMRRGKLFSRAGGPQTQSRFLLVKSFERP